jgi:L-seryl-tRNA(Ser) seleniumtransferase
MNANEGPDGPAAALRALPSVDYLLKQPAIASLLDEQPRGELVRAIRAVLDERRAAIRAGQTPPLDVPGFALDVREQLYARALPHLRRVINATGIVLHTGLGRAPLATEAVEAIAEVAGGYSNLELDLETGQRGDRHEHCRALLRELTGAEDALAVNNNAAATFLALHALAEGRGVIVSRGQLVEIGGSYRMPDIMAAARCRMIEVGTTNRTRIGDYERAITDDTAALLRVHTSNYRIAGFVESAPLDALVALGRGRNLLVLDDLGSGLLDERFIATEAGSAAAPSPADNSRSAGPPCPASWDEPTVRQSIAAGADLVLFSGDKLLGGPQAGVVVGRAALLARLRADPLARAFRPGKLTLAGLEATLRLYRDPDALRRRLPVLRMLTRVAGDLEAAARDLADCIDRFLAGAQVRCVPGESLAGGGALPVLPFATWTVHVQIPGRRSQELAAALRRRALPIICRVHEEALVFDCRTLADGDADQIAGALAEIAREL